jgi:membrane protease YdiL (CAAX protease family)
LIESLGWTLGYLIVQLIVALALLLILVLYAYEGWPPQNPDLFAILDTISGADLAWLSVYVTGGATLGALVVIVPAVFLRLRPAPRKALGEDLPNVRQMVLLTGAVLPLGIIADAVYLGATSLWETLRVRLAEFWPAIQNFGQIDTVDVIQSQAEYTAYPLLLVIVGVGPAIGEELVFRGVIGRGLVNRLGILGGVLLTSLLFACAHGTPAHAIATLPLAVFLHLAYLATRTIWAPILVHFLNNALSVSMLKYGLGEDLSVSGPMLASAIIYVTAIAAMLWKSRDGRGFDFGADWSIPVTFAEATGVVPALPRWLRVMATAGVLGFTWTFVTAAMAGS